MLKYVTKFVMNIVQNTLLITAFDKEILVFIRM